MKHYLKIIFLILLCQSCSIHKEESPTFHKEKAIISFQPQTPESKAVVNSITDLNSFSVWGGYAEKEEFVGDVVSKVVENNSTQNKQWEYSPSRYWTYNKLYNFYGIYPDNEKKAYTKVSASYENEALTIEGFDATTQYDLMYAKNIGLNSIKAPLVDLQFQHLLTHVSVELNKAEANDFISVEGVYLYSKTQGNFSLESNLEENEPDEWTTMENSKGYIGVDLSNNPQTLNTGEESYKECVTGILLLPQVMDDDSHIRLSIKYIPYNSLPSDELIASTKPIYVDFYLTNNLTWNMNMRISYKGTVTRDKNIVFNPPIITPWLDVAGGSTIID